MKVHLIRKETIREFARLDARSRLSLEDWLMRLKFADWVSPADMLSTFGGADLLGNGSNRIVFNIAGNNFRVICKYLFGDEQVHLFVCWLGSHAAYNELCKKGLQYSVSLY